MENYCDMKKDIKHVQGNCLVKLPVFDESIVMGFDLKYHGKSIQYVNSQMKHLVLSCCRAVRSTKFLHDAITTAV